MKSIALFLVAFGSSATAQTTPVRPDPDYHTLYHLFFNMHSRECQKIEGIRAASAQQGANLEAAVAAQYQITLAELVSLNAIAVSTSNKLDAIDQEAKALYDAAIQSNKTQVDPAKVISLNSRRYLTLVGAITAVQKSLSPASWNNLRGFVNQQFRSTTQMLQ